MIHKPYLSCLNAPIDFPFFYNRLVSPKKYICAHVLTHSYPTTHPCQLPAPTLLAHPLSPSARSPPYLLLSHSFQTRCGFLDCILV
ncbi:unnamed protein product [Hymenolepis diminuta]|uniref:Uncharacterized protein n=1 Tax=Hymenolepis diminuta TaxID=6216 RepID=A0A564YRM1_HYMDI|nr:unnamed protein product [Hymenolepis diminuta]